MNVKKFSANTTREALRMVRDALGADAVILSNRNVDGVIEILALASDDMSSIAPTPPEKKVLSEPVLAAFASKGKTASERAEQERKESERKDMERTDGDQASGLAGCIMTKLDEAATIGSVLDVIIRQKLNLYYVANGQRVPEDLHVANQHYLVDRAFKLKRETAQFAYQDDDLPLVMANAANAMNDTNLRGVSLG